MSYLKLFAAVCLSTFIFGGSGVYAQDVPADPSKYDRTSSFEYDPATGLLVSETLEPGRPQLCVKTSYTYDAYGNKDTVKTANCAGATGMAVFETRGSKAIYAAQNVTLSDGRTIAVPTGTFPSDSENALAQKESKVFDPRFGTALSLTGPNQLTTRWAYDDFGRPVKELRADNTATLTRYCILPGGGRDTSSNSDCPVPSPMEIPAEAISYTQTENLDTAGRQSGPATRTYVDRAGRKIRVVTEAFDGSTQKGGSGRLIAQDTDYNQLGAVEVVTDPYFLDSGASTGTGSGGYGMTLTVYEEMGRPAAVYRTDPNGSQAGISFGSRGQVQAARTRYEYAKLTTKTINDQEQFRLEERNVDGKTARITDNENAQLALQYDAFGNLVTSIDAMQNKVIVTYDVRGRKKVLNDPDTGITEYDYNALGELVWQRTPNQKAQNQQTTMKYDLLGRLVERLEKEFKSQWFYDKYANGSACNRGIGKLCESVTDHGVRRRLVYDNLGRPVSTRTDVNGSQSFISAVSYDAVSGRPASQIYPTGLKVNFNYTPRGYLSSLSLSSGATVTPLPPAGGGAAGPAATLPAGALLWQGLSYNAWGRAEQQLYGNNVLAETEFGPRTGRVDRTFAGRNGSANVLDYQYKWNGIGQMTDRIDAIGAGANTAIQDGFKYDSIGRLQNYTVSAPAIPGSMRSVTLARNAIGNLLSNDEVGVYEYAPSGVANGKPHAVKSISGSTAISFDYDNNGNMISATGGKYRQISYTSFNLPDGERGVVGAGGPQYRWMYDEAHQRIKETRIDATGSHITWMLHPDAANGLSFESEDSGGIISNRHYLTAGGISIGVLVSRGALPVLSADQDTLPAAASMELVKAEYWHQEMQGSLVATTDHAGEVTGRYSYDPFGKRRSLNGSYDADGNLVYNWNNTNSGTDRGYTGHEHLDEVGIIHMNGRLFDPRLGVFLQGDPLIQDPFNLQNYNRYAYCYSDPMICTDPTGQFSMFGHRILPGLFNSRNLRLVASIGAAFILGPGSGIWGAQWGALGGLGITSPLAQTAIAGFASGAIASGDFKGGLQGAFSAGIFYGAGSLIRAGGLGFAAGVAVHAVAGCVTSEVGGGSCGSGALSAAFSKAATSTDAVKSLTASNQMTALIINSTIGGTASVLGGGKFANGAQTGAFSYVFNCLGSPESCMSLFARIGTQLGAGAGILASIACDLTTAFSCAPVNPAIVPAAAATVGVAGAALGAIADSFYTNSGAKPPKDTQPITNPPQAPVIPPDWESKPGRNGGEVFYPPGTNPADGEHIRVMPPGSSPVPGYEDGYWRWVNGNKQPMDPSTGKPGKGQGDTHVPLPPDSVPPRRR